MSYELSSLNILKTLLSHDNRILTRGYAGPLKAERTYFDEERISNTMLNFLYTNRIYVSIVIAIFAGQGFHAFYQGLPKAGSVLDGIALLGFVLLLLLIRKMNGTIFDRATLALIFITVLMACIIPGLVTLFSNMGL